MKIHNQSGMTIIGFLIVLSIVIFFSYLGMKIGPMYMEYFSVVSALNEVAEERGSARVSPFDLRVKVLNRLYVSYTKNVKERHIRIIRGNGVQLQVKYEVREELIGNLDIVAKFDKIVTLSN